MTRKDERKWTSGKNKKSVIKFTMIYNPNKFGETMPKDERKKKSLVGWFDDKTWDLDFEPRLGVIEIPTLRTYKDDKNCVKVCITIEELK